MARLLVAASQIIGGKRVQYGHLYCEGCGGLRGHVLPAVQVRQLLGVHDRMHHGGRPTAVCSKSKAPR